MGNSSFKVFIQTNDKQYIGALLSKYSIIKSAVSPDLFQVEIMNVKDHQNLLNYENKKYLRNGKLVVWKYQDLQSFTLTRFLPPSLMNYTGRAVVIDPDVFAISKTDICELFNRDMKNKAILACPHKSGGFKSSVMLLDCQKLKHWDWDLDIQKLFKHEIDYADWITLKREDPYTIGELEDRWNHFDTLMGDTKLIHFTKRLTQPWKTGLKVDFSYDNQGGVIRRTLRKILRRKNTESVYQQNPHLDQVNFFFELVRNALDDKFISLDDIKMNISQGYVRKDLINCL